MLFEHHQESFKSSKHIEGHPQAKRVSRRQSKLNEFKIPNPVTNTLPFQNSSYLPQMPTAIKNQLAGVDYLTFSNVNSIGKCNKPGPFTVNKRNSRFSKRLLAMQSALEMQSLRMHNFTTGQVEEQVFQDDFGESEGNYMSLMDEQKNSMDMECMMGQNLDREVELDFDLEMCNDQSEVTEVEYYSQTDIRPEINYNEYESYLNV